VLVEKPIAATLKAFSILYRIEPTVTAHKKSETPQQSCFQYPLSDRTHCNY